MKRALYSVGFVANSLLRGAGNFYLIERLFRLAAGPNTILHAAPNHA